MNITPVNELNPTKAQQEQVQQEKQEYKLISKFVRIKGLSLFGYSEKELDNLKYGDGTIDILKIK